MFGKALSNLVGAGKKIVDETEQIDDRFYAEVIDELSSGYKDKALVGKAIAQSDGNEGKFDSIYMKLRAKALQEKFIKEDKLSQQVQKQTETIREIKRETIGDEKKRRERMDLKLAAGSYKEIFNKEIKK